MSNVLCQGHSEEVGLQPQRATAHACEIFTALIHYLLHISWHPCVATTAFRSDATACCAVFCSVQIAGCSPAEATTLRKLCLSLRRSFESNQTTVSRPRFKE